MGIQGVINKAIKKEANRMKLTKEQLNNLRNRKVLIEQRQAELTIFDNEYSQYMRKVLEIHGCNTNETYSVDLDNGKILKVEKKEEPKKSIIERP